jgi:glycerophosphoryl diester phosphodiesterase
LAAAEIEALFAQPIAHRGLHDARAGVIENTPSAVRRAIQGGFGIEVDVQATADGAAVVFHDDDLERLTFGTGAVAAKTLAELRQVRLRDTSDGFWTLEELLEEVAGRAPLVVEVKSSFTGSLDLARAVADRLAAYRGPIAAKSFDPRVVAAIRQRRPALPRGIIGCAYADDEDWRFLSARERFALRHLLHWPWTRPDFISWHVHDLPRTATSLARRIGRPIMTWTVRTPAEQARAGLYADQMVFEGFLP